MSTFLDEESRALAKLGLSPSQSKIYLAILMLGKTPVKDISQVSKIGLEDVYKFLPSLVELGLITKHLGSPIQYAAIEPNEAFKLLLDHLDRKNLDLHNEAEKALKKINNDINFIYSKNLDTTFLSSNENIRTLIEAAKEAKQTIDFTTRYNLFVYSMNCLNLAEEIKEMKKAAQRGVKFRMLLDKPETSKSVSELSFQVSDSQSLILNQNFQYRYVDFPLKCVLIIYDNKRCVIETSKAQDVKFSPSLWSDNNILVELCKSYFDKHWGSAFKPLRNINNTSRERKSKYHDTVSSVVGCV